MGWFGRLLPRQRSRLARGAKDKEHAMSQTVLHSSSISARTRSTSLATMSAARSCCVRSGRVVRWRHGLTLTHFANRVRSQSDRVSARSLGRPTRRAPAKCQTACATVSASFQWVSYFYNTDASACREGYANAAPAAPQNFAHQCKTTFATHISIRIRANDCSVYCWKNCIIASRTRWRQSLRLPRRACGPRKLWRGADWRSKAGWSLWAGARPVASSQLVERKAHRCHSRRIRAVRHA